MKFLKGTVTLNSSMLRQMEDSGKIELIDLNMRRGGIEGEKELLENITNFYKDLFGHPDDSTISLVIDNPRKIQEKYKVVLVNEFTFEKIKNVVFKRDHNKSPGPDGFPAEFY